MADMEWRMQRISLSFVMTLMWVQTEASSAIDHTSAYKFKPVLLRELTGNLCETISLEIPLQLQTLNLKDMSHHDSTSLKFGWIIVWPNTICNFTTLLVELARLLKTYTQVTQLTYGN